MGPHASFATWVEVTAPEGAINHCGNKSYLWIRMWRIYWNIRIFKYICNFCNMNICVIFYPNICIILFHTNLDIHLYRFLDMNIFGYSFVSKSIRMPHSALDVKTFPSSYFYHQITVWVVDYASVQTIHIILEIQIVFAFR